MNDSEDPDLLYRLARISVSIAYLFSSKYFQCYILDHCRVHCHDFYSITGFLFIMFSLSRSDSVHHIFQLLTEYYRFTISTRFQSGNKCESLILNPDKYIPVGTGNFSRWISLHNK